MNPATISQCNHITKGNNCKKCGIYIHKQNHAIKSTNYESIFSCSTQKYLRNLRKTKHQIFDYKMHEQLYAIAYLCEQYQIDIETQALAITLVARCLSKNKNLLSNKNNKQLFIVTCLILACKTIELDASFLQQCEILEHEKQQYVRLQRQILKMLDYSIQKSTFVTFVHFYLVSGVFFESDQVEIWGVYRLEERVVEKVKECMETGRFLGEDAEKCAINIVMDVRSQFELVSWNQELEIFRSVNALTVRPTCRKNILKPLNYKPFSMKKEDQKRAMKNIKKENKSATNSLMKSETLFKIKTIAIKKKIQDHKDQNTQSMNNLLLTSLSHCLTINQQKSINNKTIDKLRPLHSLRQAALRRL